MGKYRSRLCTPLNLAALQWRGDRARRQGLGTSTCPSQLAPLHHALGLPTNNLLHSPQPQHTAGVHSLRGVLYLPAIVLQQVPLLHRRQVGGGAEVQVVAVDKDLMGSGAGRGIKQAVAHALPPWCCWDVYFHLSICSGLFYAAAGSVKAHSNQLTHALCPVLTRLELGGRGAIGSADHCDPRQLDGAVEGDVQQQLWVVLFTV